MTIQDQIDQLKKEFEEFKKQIPTPTLLWSDNGCKYVEAKPTRYYPNGAYMDEPEIGTPYWIKGEYSEVVSSQEDGFYWEGDRLEMDRLERQEIFPTEGACVKSKRRDDLTAKMYRDMRNERINGEWVADWGDVDEWKWTPMLRDNGKVLNQDGLLSRAVGDFYYKNQTFIEDLKALGWSEEELKIVWFRV